MAETHICLGIKGHWAPRQPGDSTLAVTKRADPFFTQTASQKGVQDWGELWLNAQACWAWLGPRQAPTRGPHEPLGKSLKFFQPASLPVGWG